LGPISIFYAYTYLVFNPSDRRYNQMAAGLAASSAMSTLTGPAAI
jgi:cbb3-type cytochrome oxidase subunit 3